MSIKKILLLGSMALALAAFAAPTVASAAEIKDAGKQVHDETFELTSTTTNVGGNHVFDKTKFEALGSGIECVVHATVTVDTATVHVTSFTITTSTCTSFGNPYSNCEVESDNPTVPFPVTVDAEKFTMTSGTIDGALKTKAGAPEACFTTTNNITIKNVTLTPNNTKAISSLALGGELRVDTALNPSPGSKATAVGTLQVVGAAAGTYEIA